MNRTTISCFILDICSFSGKGRSYRDSHLQCAVHSAHLTHPPWKHLMPEMLFDMNRTSIFCFTIDTCSFSGKGGSYCDSHLECPMHSYHHTHHVWKCFMRESTSHICRMSLSCFTLSLCGLSGRISFGSLLRSISHLRWNG